jgi:hypothetical protein
VKALSILQPWAHAILHLGKDIENRDWKPWNPGLKFRGRFLIHAGKGFDHDGFDWIADRLPGLAPEGFPRGGIVGVAEIMDCVMEGPDSSPWFLGPYGFVLENAKPLPFIPLKGRLGFFEVPDELVTPALRNIDGDETKCPSPLRT